MEILANGKLKLSKENRIMGQRECNMINSQCAINYGLICHYHYAIINKKSLIRKSLGSFQIITFHPEHLECSWEWNLKKNNNNTWDIDHVYIRNNYKKILDVYNITNEEYNIFEENFSL
jgi:hypothetical protein